MLRPALIGTGKKAKCTKRQAAAVSSADRFELVELRPEKRQNAFFGKFQGFHGISKTALFRAFPECQKIKAGSSPAPCAPAASLIFAE